MTASRPDQSDPLIGRTFGQWTVLAADPTRKRFLCQCQCGNVRQLALGAPLDGGARGCGGCKLTPRPGPAKLNDRATELAALEARVARNKNGGGLD